MTRSRISEFFSTPAVSPSGFVPCPAAVLACLTPEQHRGMAELYQAARERVEATGRAAHFRRRTTFSVN